MTKNVVNALVMRLIVFVPLETSDDLIEVSRFPRSILILPSIRLCLEFAFGLEDFFVLVETFGSFCSDESIRFVACIANGCESCTLLLLGNKACMRDNATSGDLLIESQSCNGTEGK